MLVRVVLAGVYEQRLLTQQVTRMNAYAGAIAGNRELCAGRPGAPLAAEIEVVPLVR